MSRYALLLFFEYFFNSVLIYSVPSILEMRHYKLSMNSCIRYFLVSFISFYQYLAAKLNNSVGEYILKDGQL